MTRSSSQQTPASAPAPAPAQAKTEAAQTEAAPAEATEAEKSKEAEKGEKAEQGERSEAQSSERQSSQAEAHALGARAGTPEAAAASDSETDPDPGAPAAAQSRLPALVRTMTATAIGKPQQEAGPVGRPGKAALAGAAVVGALLVSVPFLVLAGNNDDGPERTKAAGAGTVLDGSGPEAPGEFAVTAPETGAAAEDGEKEEKDEAKPEKGGNPVPAIPPGGGGKAGTKEDNAPNDPLKKADSSKETSLETSKETSKGKPEAGSGGRNEPAKAQPAVTFSGPVSFRSHLSGRCLDVPGHNFNDGQPLFMWDCNGADAQKWRFGSDGTIRARDKCLDVANANFANGSRIQLAWCNGSAAQKFTLNGAHDLVNTVVGKCVDIPNHSKGRGPETYLILWECTGLDNQKWST
ncbi:RICIN domain-containing protein [Streptomyces sp. CNS654]|uniref:RICIN domain-containing protein n=1 Tax=Streptomyces sp. CNS654 TaxID=1506995 RepID=UPI000516CC95|nr:RICIN domain-containing protein [Streptomyces sp. CNS654]